MKSGVWGCLVDMIFKITILISLTFLFTVFICFKVSILAMILQGLFSITCFLSFFYLLTSGFGYKKKKESMLLFVSSKNKVSGSVLRFKKFLFLYFLFEGGLDFVFIISYFLENFLFDIVLLFKQGLFPFFVYHFFMKESVLKSYFFSKGVVVFLLLSKMWSMVLFSKTMFCLEFYFIHVGLSMIYMTLGLNKKFSLLMSLGFMLNNLFLFVMCEIFPFKMLMGYGVILACLYLDQFCYNFSDLNMKFSSAFMFNLTQGGYFSFFMFLKITCLMTIFQYGGYWFLFLYFGVSSIYLCYAMMSVISYIKMKMKGLEVKSILFFVGVLFESWELNFIYGGFIHYF